MRSLFRHPNYCEKILHFFFPSTTMSGKNINLEDKKIKKSDLYKSKKVLKVDDIDVNKILVSKKEPYGTNKSINNFIGYNDDDVIRPLCVKISQMTRYVKCFDGNKTMSFNLFMVIMINT